MTTIAVIAMGEMGAGIASRLVKHGARVLTSLEGRSAGSAARAQAAGVEAVSDGELAEQAEIILSVVPPSSAGALAERFLPLLERAARKPTFIDCNAIAPQTVTGIAQLFSERGLPFGDGGILGGPPGPEIVGARFYLSGPVDAEAAALKQHGLNASVISPELGDASALKMSYAGITKGFQALAASMTLAAERSGMADRLIEELKTSQQPLYNSLARSLPRMYAKAYRWDGEMLEIAKFLEPEKPEEAMLYPAAKLYRRIAAAHAEGPHANDIVTLSRFQKEK